MRAGVVVTQDALVEGVHFRLDWLPWRELGFRAAAVNISDLSASAARPEALLVTLAVPGDVDVARVVELYEGLAEAGVPVRGGDTTRAGSIVLSVTALGRSERVPGPAPAPVRATSLVVTGPLGAAGEAFRAGRLRPAAAPRSRRACGSAPSRRRCSTSRTGSPSTRVTSPVAPAAGSSSTSTLSRGRASWTISASARTSSCSPTTPDPLDFPVIGRCEEGEGVLLLHDGEPYALPGYEHFRG